MRFFMCVVPLVSLILAVMLLPAVVMCAVNDAVSTRAVMVFHVFVDFETVGLWVTRRLW